MRGGDDVKQNLVSNIAVVYLNIFHMLIKSKIVSDEDSSLIITMYGLLQCMGIEKGDEMSRFSRNNCSHIISHATHP